MAEFYLLEACADAGVSQGVWVSQTRTQEAGAPAPGRSRVSGRRMVRQRIRVLLLGRRALFFTTDLPQKTVVSLATWAFFSHTR